MAHQHSGVHRLADLAPTAPTPLRIAELEVEFHPPPGAPEPPPHRGLPDRPPATTDLRATELYLNRELTYLNFLFRVLHESEDARTPLLERLKFLAIVASNV